MKTFSKFLSRITGFACIVLAAMLTSCIVEDVGRAEPGCYEQFLESGFYTLRVEYRDGDVKGTPNIGPYAALRSEYKVSGLIQVEINGKVVQEKQLDYLSINGSKNYRWNIINFRVQESGLVRFRFQGEIESWISDRQLSTYRFVK